jgi:8-oxo-dGTP pyrophosphatase MutT (NUDIX family)
MKRNVRYQAAIIKDNRVLLLRVKDHLDGVSFWLLPGGGREDGETEHDCIRREVLEETTLQVQIERFLFEIPDIPEGMYKTLRTYLCSVIGGEARPGREPEVDTDEIAVIQEVRWVDLRKPASWSPEVIEDRMTFPVLSRLREEIGNIQSENKPDCD